jgi:hypothetical protein
MVTGVQIRPPPRIEKWLCSVGFGLKVDKSKKTASLNFASIMAVYMFDLFGCQVIALMGTTSQF